VFFAFGAFSIYGINADNGLYPACHQDVKSFLKRIWGCHSGRPDIAKRRGDVAWRGSLHREGRGLASLNFQRTLTSLISLQRNSFGGTVKRVVVVCRCLPVVVFFDDATV
jgi:hypothetical protein